MDLSAQNEIDSIKNEIQSIVDELNNISYGIKKDFYGIGNDVCAMSLTKSAQHFSTVKTKLSRMDTSAVTDEFKAKMEVERKQQEANVQEAQKAQTMVSGRLSSGNSSIESKTTSTTKMNSSTKTTSTSAKSKSTKNSVESLLSSILKGFKR